MYPIKEIIYVKLRLNCKLTVYKFTSFGSLEANALAIGDLMLTVLAAS